MYSEYNDGYFRNYKYSNWNVGKAYLNILMV